METICFRRLEREQLLSPETDVLGGNAVHVYLFLCDVPRSFLEQASLGLSADERLKAAGLHLLQDRCCFLLGRVVLRRLLAHHLGIRPDEVRFSRNAWGKPLLAGTRDGHGLSFNVSHARWLACIALTRGRRVGVDVEYIRDVPEYEEIVHSFFTAREYDAMQQRVAAERQTFFFSLWSRKEAFVKATGEGLSRPLDSFELPPVDVLSPFDPHHDMQVQPSRMPGWTMVSFVPAPGCVGALAVAEAHP